MRTALKRTGLVLAGAAVLTLGIDYAAMAATGKSLLLGKVNKSSKTTTVQNTKSGPALSLKTKSNAAAPLKVNGKGKVVNLNADTVDGVDSTALQRKLQSCAPGKAVTTVAATGAVSCGTLPRTAVWKLPTDADLFGLSTLTLRTGTYPAGSYLVTSTVAIGSGSTATILSCRLGRSDGSTTNRFSGQTSAVSGQSYNSAVGTVTLTRPELFFVTCTPNTGTIALDQIVTQISVVPLDGGSKGVLTTG